MKLLYKGKSNNRFTHNNLYYCETSFFLLQKIESIITNCVTETTRENFHIVIHSNKHSQWITIRDIDYFIDNFKYLNGQEILKVERKNKLKKIQNVL